MLETTLAGYFEPGSNPRTPPASADWVFMLPTLGWERTICLGDPGPSVVGELTEFCDVVTVVRDGERFEALEVEEGSVGLILVTSSAARVFERSATLRGQIGRALSPSGAVFEERDTGCLGARLPAGVRLWRTPGRGPLETAVVGTDSCATRYVLERQLDGTRASVSRVKDLLGGRPPPRVSVRPGTGSRPVLSSRPGAGLLDRAARAAARLGVATLQGAERWAVRQPRTAGLVRSYARLRPARDSDDGRLPAYLRAIAGRHGMDVDALGWVLVGGGTYRSRKVVFHLLDPESGQLRYLVKVTRDPRFNDRLESAHRALRDLQTFELGGDPVIPGPAFADCCSGRAVLAETAVLGDPFEQRAAFTPDCQVVARSIDALTRLGRLTARPGSPQRVGAALERLVTAFEAVYAPSDYERDVLRGHVDDLARGAAELPVVFQHGDTHPGNLVVTDSGRTGLLDWEAGDSEGLPLWDLFHFLWTTCAVSDGARNLREQVACFERHFVGRSHFRPLLDGAVQSYCDRVGVGAELVDPLFHVSWMHRALREAALLPADRLERGRARTLLRLSIERHGGRPGMVPGST